MRHLLCLALGLLTASSSLAADVYPGIAREITKRTRVAREAGGKVD